MSLDINSTNGPCLFRSPRHKQPYIACQQISVKMPTPATCPRGVSHSSYSAVVVIVLHGPPFALHSCGTSPERQRHCWSKIEKSHIIAGLLSNFFFASFVVFKSVFLPRAPFIINPTSFFSHIHHLLFLTCSWVTGMRRCLESSLRVLTSVLMSSLQPTSTTLALGQNSCVSPCHCWEKNTEIPHWLCQIRE